MVNYSLKIKGLRFILDLSQIEFANKIGVTRAIVSQMEMGNQKPTLDTITKLCEVFKLKYEYFFDNEMSTSDAFLDNSKTIASEDNINKPKYTYNEIPENTSCEWLIKLLNHQENLIHNLQQLVDYQKKELDRLRKHQ